MYTKRLRYNEPLYFIYAPPQTDLDRPNARLPELVRPDSDKFNNSVYYYWWEFLRLNNEYIKCCEAGGTGEHAKLYEDFGDVRSGSRVAIDGNEFKAWWIERGAKLFAEPQKLDDIKLLDEIPQHHSFQHYALVSIPLRTDLDITLDVLKELIRDEIEGYRKYYPNQSFAKYPVKQRPVLSALDDALRCKLAQINNTNRDLYFLADVARLQFPKYSAKNGDDLYAIKTRRVSRALQRADLLIANVIKGSFPDYQE